MEEHRLQLRFWGVRGSIPTPGPATARTGGNTACVEVLSPGQRAVVAIDAGSGFRELGRALAAGARPDAVHLLLSHFHWDHLQGLPFFPPLYDPQTPLCVAATCAPRELHQRLAAQMSSPFFPVDWDSLAPRPELAAIGESVVIESLRVYPFPLNHPQGCSGFRIESGGAVVVYASDCQYGDRTLDQVLLRHCEGADVLVFDAQHTPEEAMRHGGWGHSSWLDATTVAAQAGVGELVLFHHDPGHGDAQLDDMLLQARRCFPATRLATEGEAVWI